MTLRLRYSVRSHVGKVREGNEDSAYAGSRLALVADGMGGHAAGEVASSAVVQTLAALDEDEAGLDLLEVLSTAVRAANDHLRAMVDADAALDGMGTTLTVMLSSGTRLGLAHVGDSRAYLLRDGEFTQLTHDQTLVQRMVDEGRITAEQAETHPQRSLLTQALDGREGVEPDLSVREARLGDRYLLCSDGLSGYVSPDAMADSLRIADADEAAETLVDLALRAGAPDNVTAVIADVVEDGAGLLDTPVVGGAAAEQDAVPSATPAFVMLGGASLSPQQQAAKRAAHRRRRPYADEEGLERTPPTGLPPVLDDNARPVTRGGRRQQRRHRAWYRRPLPLSFTALVIIVVAGVLITWAVVASSWYVARDGEDTALYHGIQSAPLGVSLSNVEQRGAALKELLPVDQQLVSGGIVADSRADGVCILARLRYKAEVAAYERSQPPVRRTPRSSASASRSASTGPGGANPSVRVSAAPRPSALPSPLRSPLPTPSPTPRPSPTPAAPSPTPLPASCPP